jgi:hypothetical protein
LITLHDMVTTQAVSEEGADVLRKMALTGQSFLVYARPRNAGKTTLANAILAEALGAEATGGYLVVAEIGHSGRPWYLAGKEVVRLFDVLADNGVDGAAASYVRYLIKVRPLGDPVELHTPRVVEEIHEVVPREGQAPTTFHLYRSSGI